MLERTLHDLVLSYRSTGQGRELIMEKVAALVYGFHGKYGFDDEDDAADALFKFRARLEKLVDRFEDRGLPFDAYLAASLRYLARTVRRDRRRAADRESVCERAVFSEMSKSDSAFEIGGSPDELESDSQAMPIGRGQGATSASKRRPQAGGGAVPRCTAETAAYSSRLVFLALKCAWEIDEEGIARTASAAGVGREWLASAIEQARRSLVSERSRVERLTERRNASWTRTRLLEARLAGETDPYRKERLAASMERERGRYANAKAELAALRTIVPNSIVARILGIPKGTVDSGLYYLRKRFGPLA